jgi:hypothetical protein
MPLTIYGFHEHPHEFAATKVGAPLEDCVFVLDFSRPLKRVRWLRFGPTVGLLVPVVHIGEEAGGYVVGVHHDQPYFVDIPKYWKQHRRRTRTLRLPPVAPFQLIADFGRHFPEDCDP